MAFLKVSFFIAFISLAIVHSDPVPTKLDVPSVLSSNDLIVGSRTYDDQLVHEENIAIGASIIGKKVIHEQTIKVLTNHVITQVLALDQATGNTGAEVTVTKGGPGQDSITLRFKSQRFRGIYFNVKVYAKIKH